MVVSRVGGQGRSFWPGSGQRDAFSLADVEKALSVVDQERKQPREGALGLQRRQGPWLVRSCPKEEVGPRTELREEPGRANGTG